MKWLLMSLVTVFFLSGCTSLGQIQEKQASLPKPSSTGTTATPSEPLIRLDGTQVLLPEGLTGQIPEGAHAFGSTTILLEGIAEEVANISFLECPKGAPDSGCIGNHRAIILEEAVSVAGRAANYYEAQYQKNSAAADDRTWLELHTVVPLPSGRRVDIVGQVLSGSGKEITLRSIYDRLLSSLSR